VLLGDDGVRLPSRDSVAADNCRLACRVSADCCNARGVCGKEEGMHTEDDASAIAASLNDPPCFEAVVERHFARMLDYLTRRVGSQVAADLVADTFERAFRDRARFANADGSALPWLYGIAGNLVRMHRRTEARRLRALAREARSRTSASPDPTARGALDPLLLGALAGLTQPLREVLLLHAWGELSNEEIAVALALSPEAVRTRLHRARSRVAAQIGLTSSNLTSAAMTAEPRTPEQKEAM
jgi:RNA polymerase sigma-70 factor (ECF subfamily)